MLFQSSILKEIAPMELPYSDFNSQAHEFNSSGQNSFQKRELGKLEELNPFSPSHNVSKKRRRKKQQGYKLFMET